MKIMKLGKKVASINEHPNDKEVTDQNFISVDDILISIIRNQIRKRADQ